MIPELGHFALVMALCLAVMQSVLPLAGAWSGRIEWMDSARHTAPAQLLAVAVAYGCLTHAFISNDFSVLYVASHSNSALPLLYRISGVWGAHEGSLLLWVLMLTGWGAAVALAGRRLPKAVAARVLAVIGMVASGFLLFILATSNPFERLLPPALDGRDLNPLLQDPGLIFHPPLLYMGYVGFVVPFAFAVAALLGGHLDSAWARWVRPWTTTAWAFLTAGIALGSYWAYYELGWGGWWFWDPVENASFLPWLTGLALMHALAVTDKRGGFRSWSVLLAIATFALTLLGAFLVRSGVLTSVHAFASDPDRGLFLLLFLALTAGASLSLYAVRAHRLGPASPFRLNSLETMLLANNVILLNGAATVLLGTLYPLLIDALGMRKLSVGPPYFNTVFVPLVLPLIFLVGLAPLARWKHGLAEDALAAARHALVPVLLMVLIVAWPGSGVFVWYVAVACCLAVWIAALIAADLYRSARGRGVWRAMGGLSRARAGMHLAHLGLAVSIVGIAVTSAYESARDVRMAPGDDVEVADYTFRMVDLRRRQGPNYSATIATMAVSRDGRPYTIMYPEKRFYPVQRSSMTQVAMDAGLLRDLYVALAEPLDASGTGAWIVRVYHKPFVRWIWLGALMMIAGAGLAAADRRYRRLAEQRRTAARVPGVRSGRG
ncbi:MAG: heme lyase CcmF/NrfE family subunit [Aquisalimonadaceae bacterium]